MTLPVYLDNLATTPLAPEAGEAMRRWFDEEFGNASSRSHAYGWHASDAVEQARDDVAALIGARRSSQIAFTSGATEANNFAIKGVAHAFAGEAPHIVTTAIEHPSVLEACHFVRDCGAGVTFVRPDANGWIDPQAIASSIGPRTRLVSVMAANNEVGTLQDISSIAAITRERDVLLHVDAAQAIGKVAFDVSALGAQIVSISAHKLYGPQGVGAVYVDGAATKLPPLVHGGGQERGLRSGTLPVAQIVGFGAAARVARDHWREDAAHTGELATVLLERLAAAGVALNGSAVNRLPGCVNVSVGGVASGALLAALPGLALSSGSACSSHHGGGSHVLAAMGLSTDRQRGAIRIGIGRYTRREDVSAAGDQIVSACNALRSGRS